MLSYVIFSRQVSTWDKMDLKEYLYKNNITITEFARLLDLNRSFIYRWFDGIQFPSEEVLKQISELTNGTIKTKNQLVDRRKNGKNKG